MQILPSRDGQARTGKLVAFLTTLVLVGNVAALADHRDPQPNTNPTERSTAAAEPTTATSDQARSDEPVSNHTAADDGDAIRAAQVTLPDGANNIEPAPPSNEGSSATSTASEDAPVSAPEPEHDHNHAPEPTPEPEPEPAHDHTHEPAPEPEPEPDPCGDTPQHECRGQAQLDKVSWPWQQSGWTIEFEPGRDGYKGIARPSTDTITVWVRQSQSDASILGTIGHEIGHIIDFEYLTDDEKSQYRDIRGLGHDSSWYPCTGDECGEGDPPSDHASPAGDFAESFMWCKITTADHFSSELAGPPSGSQCQQLEPLFAPN